MSEDGNSGNDNFSRQIKSIFCQPCLDQDKQSTAEKFCSTCNEFQCKDCLKVHYRYAYMRGHTLVKAYEAVKEKASFDMIGLDQCNQHKKNFKKFCEDDNQLCCSTCIKVDHLRCYSVVDVKKVVRKSASKNSTLKVVLEEVKRKAEIIIKNVVISKEKLDEDIKDIPLKIRRMRDEVIKMFDEFEVSVVKDAKSFQTETLEKMSRKQSLTEKYLADIQSCLETIGNVYRNGTSLQKFIVEHQMQKDVNVLKTNVDAECQDLETVTVNFDFDEVLKLPPLRTIDYVPGQLSVTSYLSETASAISPDIIPMKLTQVISVDLKQSKDDKMEPLYSGIDFLPDGRLVAVDYRNGKCLVLNEKLGKVGSFQLSYPPQSVVTVSEQELAITSGSAYKVDILRVNKSNDITLYRTYNVKTRYNITGLKDGRHLFAGTYCHLTPVRILSYTGEEKDFNINFPYKTYHNNTSACNYIRNSDKVVLTDRCEDTVYIYDIKTNTRVVVKDDQIKEPRGVAVGPSDTILVCSRNTDSIVQISQTGRILSSYKIDMKNPRHICVSRDKLFLVVTNSYLGKGKLQKMKISY